MIPAFVCQKPKSWQKCDSLCTARVKKVGKCADSCHFESIRDMNTAVPAKELLRKYIIDIFGMQEPFQIFRKN